MIRILDTNVLIDVLRGDSRVVDTLKDHDPATLAIPAFVRAELVLGACLAADGHEERFVVERMLQSLRLLTFDERCANAYAGLHAVLQRKGTLIGIADIMIAATALAHDAIVVTANTREFTRVPGLTTENWRAA